MDPVAHEQDSPSKGIHIRPPKGDETRIIASFQAEMARVTEAKTLDLEVVERAVRRVLEDPQRGFYLVAESAGEVVASLLVTKEWSDWRDAWFWWIQSVFVQESARRMGVYSRLHEKVLSMARAAGDVIGVRLYVEEENRRAMSCYERQGMHKTRYHLYEQLLAPLDADAQL